MSDSYSFHSGDTPLLVSVPHDGRRLPDSIARQMTDVGKSVPDTDWHVARLYDFVKELGGSMIVAGYSRYVVDLNRPADDVAMYEGQLATGLCPTRTFGGEDLYVDGVSIDVVDRVRRYWRPYHDRIETTLSNLREAHGYALLWDAHSIVSRVPTLFDGELPVLNIGTWDGRSCDETISNAVMRAAEASPYDAVLNARFKGGHITRHFGQPEKKIHAMQLEMAQRAYMDEESRRYDDVKASRLCDTLKNLLGVFTNTAAVTRL